MNANNSQGKLPRNSCVLFVETTDNIASVLDFMKLSGLIHFTSSFLIVEYKNILRSRRISIWKSYAAKTPEILQDPDYKIEASWSSEGSLSFKRYFPFRRVHRSYLKHSARSLHNNQALALLGDDTCQIPFAVNDSLIIRVSIATCEVNLPTCRTQLSPSSRSGCDAAVGWYGAVALD